MISRNVKSFIGIILCSSCMSAQNLVLNPSFEEYSRCPTQEDQLVYVNEWSNPSKSSPDYYNSCGGDTQNNQTVVGIPYNFNGYQTAHTGQGYVGIVLCSSEASYREYIQTKLKEKLTAGKQYQFSFWISLADSTQYKTNGLSVCFSENNNLRTDNIKDGGIILSSNHGKTVWCELKKCYENKDWVQIRGIYTAIGTEEYITFGIFKEDNSKLKTKRIRKARKYHMSYAYYFFDDIEVSEAQ